MVSRYVARELLEAKSKMSMSLSMENSVALAIPEACKFVYLIMTYLWLICGGLEYRRSII